MRVSSANSVDSEVKLSRTFQELAGVLDLAVKDLYKLCENGSKSDTGALVGKATVLLNDRVKSTLSIFTDTASQSHQSIMITMLTRALLSDAVSTCLKQSRYDVEVENNSGFIVLPMRDDNGIVFRFICKQNTIDLRGWIGQIEMLIDKLKMYDDFIAQLEDQISKKFIPTSQVNNLQLQSNDLFEDMAIINFVMFRAQVMLPLKSSACYFLWRVYPENPKNTGPGTLLFEVHTDLGYLAKDALLKILGSNENLRIQGRALKAFIQSSVPVVPQLTSPPMYPPVPPPVHRVNHQATALYHYPQSVGAMGPPQNGSYPGPQMFNPPVRTAMDGYEQVSSSWAPGSQPPIGHRSR